MKVEAKLMQEETKRKKKGKKRRHPVNEPRTVNRDPQNIVTR